MSFSAYFSPFGASLPGKFHAISWKLSCN